MSDLQKEREIPVFTVWKNNAILKNIFLINSPPILDNNQVFEETLLVGRHPDCDIRLEHPSISRFHLRIHSFPASKSLFLTDLSSVHGTWVSDKRIEPDSRTKVEEGDSLRLGGSSRVYKLHWIPLSQAYDVSQSYVPPLDFVEQQEDEDEIIKNETSEGDEESRNVDSISDDIIKGLEALDVCVNDHLMVAENVLPQSPPLQPQKLVSVKNEAIELADSDVEGLESLCLDEISIDLAQKDTLIAPSICHENFECAGVEPVAPTLEGMVPQIHREDLKDDDVESMDSILEGMVPQIHREDLKDEDVESMDSILEGMASQIHREDLKDEDIESMDSILEGLVPLFLGENWEWVGQEENYLPCPTEDHSQLSVDDHPALEESGTSCLDETSQHLSPKATLLTPVMPDNMKFPTSENVKDDEIGLCSPTGTSWAGQEENYLPCPTEDHSQLSEDDHPALEESGTSCLDEISQHLSPKATLLTPVMPDNMEFPTSENVKDDEIGLCSLEAVSSDENSQWSSQKAVPTAPLMPDYMEVLAQDNVDNMTAEGRQEFVPEIQGEDFQDSAWSFWAAGSLLSTERNPAVMETESTVPLVSNSSDLNSSTKENGDTQLWSFWSGKMGVESVCSALSDIEPFSEAENKSMINGYLSSSLNSVKSQKSARSFWSGRGKLESIGFSLSDEKSLSTSENESCADGYQSPKSLSSVKGGFGSPLMTSDQNPVDSIWSRRGKLFSSPQILTSTEVKLNEEEVFTPDKENFTPTTHKSMRKFAVLKEINGSSSCKSPLLKMNSSPNNYHENFVSPSSNKENYSPRSRQKQKIASRASANRVESLKLKERKGRRMPFQSLLVNSPQKSISESHVAAAEIKSGSCENGVACKGKCVKEELRQWNMVVDTTTLLNKESRKALQLLEGLKGTQLIIPRIVITELASLKRQVSFFRRNTEVQSALEWIQECMLRTGWWIHVQNSTEEGRPVAPTPPASPHHSQFYAFSLSGFEYQREPFSPTVEDDVLDYALGFRKNNHDGQLVLLSNDVTMKIKAMAEGMICETGEEFRESLMNPFSERFMWTDSSPRGQTWSCADDFVLKQKFYPNSLKMTPKSRENVKGLKLILLHNSRYHEQVTAIH